ncbi:PaaX family transcriptional regulator C-terminal domain-containing protein [Thalassococcus sp. S3]|uniref:PaaX family transcriptional regulator C-terminal domain-containing protein n=1 Tax=Thalassococcus sp. S3 TaxID=2017482 RepID=UPI0010246489|nr:PaaX family transcriptional regulator C-terminal domain-containing protein [Thalassococcus sp. S3]QBF29881.1 phenylacetic acid degradation protein [Thalassococcus sp. S3]
MDPLSPLITALHGEGRLRVWSLVITVFGDMVQHRGGGISTARLGRLLGRVGVEPGALRTALSRLGRDGWVTSARSGRLSIYRLSPDGLLQFAPATTQIYAAPRLHPATSWALSVTLSASGEPVTALHPLDTAPEEADCQVTGTLSHISEAFRRRSLSAPHRAALSALSADLEALSSASLPPLEAAAARVLLTHRWRRIVLRFPEIPFELMPADAPLANPRAAVAQAYQSLTPEAEAWLDTSAGDASPMPAASPSAFLRFG